MGGRLAFGLLGDRFGAKRVVVAGLVVQALAAGAYIYARDLAEFYSVATVFGFAYAGVMPLYAVLAREIFPATVMGTVFGGLALAGSLGMSFGPVAGGWIFDAAGNYRWLYLASLAVGLVAAGIAATFPSGERRRRKGGARVRYALRRGPISEARCCPSPQARSAPRLWRGRRPSRSRPRWPPKPRRAWPPPERPQRYAIACTTRS